MKNGNIRNLGIPTAGMLLGNSTIFSGLMMLESDITHNCRVKTYPDGSKEILVCDKKIFREPGWECEDESRRIEHDGGGVFDQNIRRAKTRLRDYALCNDFHYFITCTLDGEKVDRYDVKAMTKKLNSWLCNRVNRVGLKYLLVPELHKDGAIHYHGLINDALPIVDSGTMTKSGKRPVRPRYKIQKQRMLSDGWQVVYNIPDWKYGFTTAIELYGEYSKAISYVCKYIGKGIKSGERESDVAGERGKVGGRWFYSGGDLKEPEVSICDVDYSDFHSLEDAYEFQVEEANASYVRMLVPPDA